MNQEVNSVVESPLREMFLCNLCGFEFSEERYMMNHFNVCKEIQDPSDKLGSTTCIVKYENIKEEFLEESLEVLEEYEIKYDITELNIKTEEIEFTETTISEQPEQVKTDIGEEASENNQFEEKAKIPKGNQRARQSTPKSTLKCRKENRQLKCKSCDYTTTRRWHLKRHIKTHTKSKRSKPFKCTQCDYACASKYSLTRHVTRHSKDKPFKCKICDYASTERSRLQQHMSNHSGNKPFKCTICDYASVRRDNLMGHIRTHSGEKPFRCTICEYACAHSSHLNIHMRTHTQEKPFKCTICNYVSTHSSHVKTHLMTKHA